MNVGNFSVIVSPILFGSVNSPGTILTSSPNVSLPVNNLRASEHAPLTQLWPETKLGNGGQRNVSGEYGLH